MKKSYTYTNKIDNQDAQPLANPGKFVICI